MAFNVSALGFGDNVVGCYRAYPLKMYPGGNAVNFCRVCQEVRRRALRVYGHLW